ncbi:MULTISPECIES: aldehyde dehydrogenase family protein [unclassified Haladaptatus]|uniref:aldehyde dehydrogenase family protein n=1 Tax=unclassified Haladaptatus TaxID=2622732 RepID=UPI00209C0047|nr:MULTISPECIES: aldehyde dehydrogenase family protein [unclassified Haladaptatus]MCO8244729.1 aldehyde dehydrogenase family protein [Haladaptatus sp. AB643]MCO8255759.1 aldehyde dehydrogenase family protein [Haladaptatus sp. AB618]
MVQSDISFKERYPLFIDGEQMPPSTDEFISTDDPATGDSFAEIAVADSRDVDRAVTAARTAFESWRDVAPEKRGRIVHRIGRQIHDSIDELAAIECKDQGKPISQARSDMRGAWRYFEYYSGVADKLEGQSVPVGPDQVDFTLREPYGVSAQVTPWNFPGNLFARGVAPALVAGNTVVIKPAPQTALSTLRLAKLCSEAGLPDGVVNVVTGTGESTGQPLVSHSDVDTITFTGSVTTGQSIMKHAADTVTPVTLELGGKNPAIVFPDASLDRTAESIATAIFTNAGQVCSAADRLLVHEDIHDRLVERIASIVDEYEIGPGKTDPDIGPLASAEHKDRVLEYIEVGKEEGATPLIGGTVPDQPGYFVEPTIFIDVKNEMRIAQEEIFGPVLSVISFHDEEEALSIANDTKYGLTAGIFTNDITRAHRLSRYLEAGNVYVNKWFGDTTQTPFGGYKYSGIGREKGLEALDSYLQTKNVAIDISEDGSGTLPGA